MAKVLWQLTKELKGKKPRFNTKTVTLNEKPIEEVQDTDIIIPAFLNPPDLKNSLINDICDWLRSHHNKGMFGSLSGFTQKISINLIFVF